MVTWLTPTLLVTMVTWLTPSLLVTMVTWLTPSLLVTMVTWLTPWVYLRLVGAHLPPTLPPQDPINWEQVPAGPRIAPLPSAPYWLVPLSLPFPEECRVSYQERDPVQGNPDRCLLVLLHDFPEFLCDYHFPFCDVIPPGCLQLKNIIPSAQ